MWCTSSQIECASGIAFRAAISAVTLQRFRHPQDIFTQFAGFTSNLSQILFERCCSVVDVSSEAVSKANISEAGSDLEKLFHAQYERVARVIAGVIRDPARAEDLAVEVFLK